MEVLHNFTLDVIHHGMDGHLARQKAIASNLANVETPGYRRRDVTFQHQLQRAVDSHRHGAASQLQATNEEPLPLLATQVGHYGQPVVHHQTQASSLHPLQLDEPQWVENDTQRFRADNNGVDVESEMVSLAQNSSKYKALSKLHARLTQQVRSVIQQSSGM